MNEQSQAMETVWIGLDVDSKYVVAAVDETIRPGMPRVAPRLLPTHTFDRSRQGLKKLLAWAKTVSDKSATFRVVMESTGSYSEDVHMWLWEIDPATGPVVMNPKIMKDFLKSLDPRTKSDRVDSQGIARFGTDRMPTATPLLSEADRSLRELMRTREQLVAQRDALRNRHRTCRDSFVRKTLEKMIKQTQKAIDKMQKQALKTVKKTARQQADLRRLMDIFGVAEVTALTVLAELGDLRRFRSNSQLASYCGLTPKIVESGARRNKPRVSKFGNKSLRRALYMAALVNIRHKKTDLADWYWRAVERGKHPGNAIVHVMRKILDKMHLMITTEKTYERHPRTRDSAALEAV